MYIDKYIIGTCRQYLTYKYLMYCEMERKGELGGILSSIMTIILRANNPLCQMFVQGHTPLRRTLLWHIVNVALKCSAVNK